MSDDDRDNDIEGDADKRAHHNALERKRRDHIKDSFTMLRDSLPFFQGDKVRASRAQILKKAADYIQSMRRENTAHQQDIDDLKKQNRHLEDQMKLIAERRQRGQDRFKFPSKEGVAYNHDFENYGVTDKGYENSGSDDDNSPKRPRQEYWGTRILENQEEMKTIFKKKTHKISRRIAQNFKEFSDQ